MEKFNPIYSLKVEVDNGINTSPLRPENRANKFVEITRPYTLEFTITRQNSSSSQTGTFRIYGLGEPVRDAIQKDFFQFTQLRAIQLRAGYDNPNGKFMALVFNGTVKQAYSYREKNIWITDIEAYDGGFSMANGNGIASTQAPGFTATQTMAQLAKFLPGLTGTPIIGNFPTTNKRGEVLFGNAWDLIQVKSNGLALIDNGQLKVLNYSEVIQGEVPLLSSETGLLGSPKRTTSTLEFDMLFEPRLTLGQIVEVRSRTSRQYNRQWKVIGFEHRGTISESVAGDLVTNVRLWFTQQDLQLIPGTPVI